MTGLHLTDCCMFWSTPPERHTTQRAAIRTVINILIGWPPLPSSLPSTPQTPSPPPIPLQLQVRVLHHISLRKCCRSRSAQCVNLWLERAQSSFQGREASVKMDPQADSRHGCFNLELILLNTETDNCKMCQGGNFWEAGSTVTEERGIISSAGELYCKVSKEGCLLGRLVNLGFGGRETFFSGAMDGCGEQESRQVGFQILHRKLGETERRLLAGKIRAGSRLEGRTSVRRNPDKSGGKWIMIWRCRKLETQRRRD